MNLQKLAALALKVAGTNLTFTTFEVLAIPSFDIYTLHGGESSVYHAERRNFQFRISSQDAADNVITTNMVFSMDDEVYQFFFTIESVIPDLTGWADITATFNHKALL
jgi:hypothetical protein